MIYVNCTPHNVVWKDGCCERIFKTSGHIARVKEGHIIGLPDSKEGVLYIVSKLVFQSTNRKDVIAPDCGTSYYNNRNRIEGVKRFLRKGDF